jgi:cell division protein FtsI (penicillin-binding protein 3)
MSRFDDVHARGDAMADGDDVLTRAAGSVRFDGVAKQAIEVGRTRIVITGVLFALCFTVVGLRLFDLMVLRGGGEPPLAAVAGNVVTDVQRAPIVDRNGVLVAVNLKTASLYANPQKVMDATVAADQLTAVLPDLDRATVYRKLTSGRAFVWLKRNLTPAQHYAVNRLGLPGIAFQTEEKRVYPHGALLSHIVGYTDIDNNGIAGLEKYFDRQLRHPGKADTPVAISIDVRAQHVLRAEMMRAVAEYRAKAGAGVVMDVRTGEIVAMVSLPDYDPNRAGEASRDALFNRATLGVYELGSTFKTFTVAMALENGTVDINGGYDATKPIRISHFVIRDDHAKRRWLSVPEIYVYSSNIGAAKMAMDVGARRQQAFLGRLGLLDKSPVELPEVGTPLLPPRWGEVSTMTVSYGHGIAITPLQLVSAVAATVNGGIMLPATILKRDAASVPAGRRVMSGHTSEAMRKLMRQVVMFGTGRRADAPGYLVGGKTGTAEKPYHGGYRRKALVSSFVGAFPIDKPRYVVLAVLDEPHGTKETHGFASGGWTAAPVVSQVVTRLAPLMGIEPVEEIDKDERRAMMASWRQKGRTLASF